MIEAIGDQGSVRSLVRSSVSASVRAQVSALLCMGEVVGERRW